MPEEKAKLRLIVVVPERELFDGEVDSVRFNTVTGVIEVLPRHMPLMTQLAEGELVARQGEEHYYFAVHGGFAQITPAQVVILADSAERAEEIDIARAERAREEARKALEAAREHPLTPEDEKRLRERMRRAETRLRIVKMRRGGQLPRMGSAAPVSEEGSRGATG
jgi:F-type H+-transporting ATPase subunit epsilon